MFNFTVASDHLDRLLNRLHTLAKGDESATISFSLSKEGEDSIDVFYKSAIDKGDLTAVFYEKLPLIKHSGYGTASLHIREINNLRPPVFTKVNSFPYCKEVSFGFTDSILKVIYEVEWSQNSKPSEVKLSYAVLSEKTLKDDYKKVTDPLDSFISLDTESFKSGLLYCNFFKLDATSKEGNGCLIRVYNSGKLSVLGTDSNMAALYKSNTIEKEEEVLFSTVISASVFNIIDRFVKDTELIKVALKRSSLHIDTGSRRLVVPTMLNSVEDMEIYEQLFSDLGDKVANVPAKPLSETLSALIDPLVRDGSKANLKFGEEGITIETNKNSTKNLPCTLFSEKSIIINGEFLNTAIRRIIRADNEFELYYKDDANRWLLGAHKDKEQVKYLIQGLLD